MNIKEGKWTREEKERYMSKTLWLSLKYADQKEKDFIIKPKR
jgi:hypothetical protein